MYQKHPGRKTLVSRLANVYNASHAKPQTKELGLAPSCVLKGPMRPFCPHIPALLLASALLVTSCGGDEQDGQDPIDNGDPCQVACRHLADCALEFCPSSVIEDLNEVSACVSDCTLDPGFDTERLLNSSCQAIGDALCTSNPELAGSCTCPGEEAGQTNIGVACTSDDQCQGGALLGDCVPELDPDTNAATGFAGGYCVSAGCINDDACGTNNHCIPLQTGARPSDTTNFCLAGCSPSTGRGLCRVGYGCWPISQDNAQGVCFPECLSDADCTGETTCDLFTGACLNASME